MSKPARTRSAIGRRNRQRGQESEREFIAFCREHGVNADDRRLGQEREGGVGDVPVPGIGLVEVKRRARIVLDALAKSADVLAVRADRGEWWVCLRGERAAELLRAVQSLEPHDRRDVDAAGVDRPDSAD